MILSELVTIMKTTEWQRWFAILIFITIVMFSFAAFYGYTSGNYQEYHASIMNSTSAKVTVPVAMSGAAPAVGVIFLNNMLIVLLTLAGAYFIGWRIIAFMPSIYQSAVAGFMSGSYYKMGLGLQGLKIVATIGTLEFMVFAFAGSFAVILAQNPDKKLSFQVLAASGAALLAAAVLETVFFIG